MAGIFEGAVQAVVDRLRLQFQSDKERAAELLAKGATSPGYPEMGFDLLQAYGYDALSAYLKLEQDLQSRYIDYESMDDYPEISAAVDIYADDSSQPDSQLKRTLWVTSPDKTLQTNLDDLFHRTLRMDEEVWEIARSLCKYGNDFEEMLITENGVVGLNFLPAPTVRRIEGPRGELYGFVQDFRGRFGYSPHEFRKIIASRAIAVQQIQQPSLRTPDYPKGLVAALEPWEVAHFRIRGKTRRSPYGHSILESSRWIYKRLALLEDAAMIYRLQRAPERFAFYVDIGDLPPAEALAYVNKVRQRYKKKRMVNPATGKFDFKFSPLAQDADFYVPTRKGTDGARIETLGAPAWQHMDDIAYFQNKMFSSLKVPKSYLAHEEGAARAILSSEDVRFARTILRIQRELRNGFKKIARTHLAAIGIDPYKVDFEVNMTVPSAIFELAQLEVRNARADLAARMREHVSLRWVLENVYQLTDEDIAVIIKERTEDTLRDGKAAAEVEKMSAMAQASAQAAMGGGGGGMESLDNSRRLKILEKQMKALPAPRGISDRELHSGDRLAEKRANAKIEEVLSQNRLLTHRMKEVGGLLHDLSLSVRSRRAA